MDSWVPRKKELKAWLYARYGWAKLMPLIVITKDNWLGTALTYAIGLLVGREQFRTGFATTIGPVVLIPKEYSFHRAKNVCTHEIGGHVFQFWVCGLFLPFIGPWLGIVLMGIFYALLLPVLFNWFRYRLELHADVQMWKYLIEVSYEDEVLPRAERFAKTVGSKAYGWPVPQAWALWGFRRKANKLLKGNES